MPYHYNNLYVEQVSRPTMSESIQYILWLVSFSISLATHHPLLWSTVRQSDSHFHWCSQLEHHSPARLPEELQPTETGTDSTQPTFVWSVRHAFATIANVLLYIFLAYCKQDNHLYNYKTFISACRETVPCQCLLGWSHFLGSWSLPPPLL